jgi:hypothetical protein
VLARASEFNQYIERVKAENFIKVGVAGEGEPRWLPGILDSIEVSASLLVDDADANGKSGSVKIISGWSDADVSINLLLIDIPRHTNSSITPAITRFDCLKEIAGVFKNMENGSPRVYTIQHPHIAAWGMREFIFDKLKSSESRGRRIINCTLEFDEFDGISGKSQDRRLASGGDSAIIKSETPIVGDKTRRGLGELEGKYAKL